MEFGKIPILCPKCKVTVMNWNGKSTIPMTTRCRVCHRIVVYEPEIKRTRFGKEPERQTSSGTRYY